MKKRITFIDFLKFIGLSLIIMAHIGCPEKVMMVRNFDVPLMVIVSSYLGYNSYKKSSSTFDYLISRVKRLVIPTWIFLIFYLLLYYFFSTKTFTTRFYIDSFLLTRYGVNYVWIILIYLYSALLIPLIDKIGFSKKSIITVLIIYLIYEVCCHFEVFMSNRIIMSTIYYIIPYGLLTYFGYNYRRLDKSEKKHLLLFFAGLFIILVDYYFMTTGKIQNVQIAKYPPRIYYLTYGLLVSTGLFMLFEGKDYSIFRNKIIVYISSHSMWIYLWHILVLDLYKKFHLPEIWYLKFLIVYIVSILFVMIVNMILDLFDRNKDSRILKYLRY